MRIRDGPAAVRGDAPPPRSHWREPGRRRGREPRVRRPVVLPITEPLAEGRIQVLRSFVHLAGAALAALAVAVSGASAGVDRPERVPGHRDRLQREGHGLEAARPHRLAVADGDGDALRDRRRLAGRRRRRPVRLPEGGAEDLALGLHAERRGDRDVSTRPRRHRVRPEGALGRPRTGSASPCSTRTAPRASRARTSRSGSSASSPVARRAATRLIASMKVADRARSSPTRRRLAAA